LKRCSPRCRAFRRVIRTRSLAGCLQNSSLTRVGTRRSDVRRIASRNWQMRLSRNTGTDALGDLAPRRREVMANGGVSACVRRAAESDSASGDSGVQDVHEGPQSSGAPVQEGAPQEADLLSSDWPWLPCPRHEDRRRNRLVLDRVTRRLRPARFVVERTV